MIIDDQLQAEKPQPGISMDFKTRDPIVLRALPGIDEQPFAALRADVDAALATAERKLARRREDA